MLRLPFFFFFFFNDTATTEIYTLSLHDALPIWPARRRAQQRTGHRVLAGWRSGAGPHRRVAAASGAVACDHRDRKSTRLNSSHLVISYAVFCLKKKKKLRDCDRERRKEV